MAVGWRFKKREPGDMRVDPMQQEFFNTDDLTIPYALIRESIQNSLDAALPGMRTEISLRLAHIESGDGQVLLNGLIPHLQAADNAERQLPDISAALPCLVIEDFNTTGLTGDPELDDDPPKGTEKDHRFYYFWRNIGRGLKGTDNRGRWGLGKTVFPATSGINAFWGYTCQHQGRSLLMGFAMLCEHQVNDDSYNPYGFYADYRNSHFQHPITDADHLQNFVSLMKLERDDHQPGLSVVVPYPKLDTADELIAPVLMAYFHSLWTEKLLVRIQRRDDSWLTLDSLVLRDSARLDALLSSLPEKLLSSRDRNQLETNLKLLAINESAGASIARIAFPATRKETLWSQYDWESEAAEELRNQLVQQSWLVAEVEVPVYPMEAKRNPEIVHAGSFRIILGEADVSRKGMVTFVRAGMTITNAAQRNQSTGFDALVLVDNTDLGRLLGDAENPAHTDWQESALKLKGNFILGPSTVRFVKRAPAEIVRGLKETAIKQDHYLLRDYFPMPDPVAPKVSHKQGQREAGPGTTEPATPPSPSHGWFTISSARGGFRIAGTTRDPGNLRPIRVRVAYDVRTGDPFRKYSSHDFDLKHLSASVELEKVEVVALDRNILEFLPRDCDFRLIASGFDMERDLIVDASVVKGRGENEEAY